MASPKTTSIHSPTPTPSKYHHSNTFPLAPPLQPVMTIIEATSEIGSHGKLHQQALYQHSCQKTLQRQLQWLFLQPYQQLLCLNQCRLTMPTDNATNNEQQACPPSGIPNVHQSNINQYMPPYTPEHQPYLFSTVHQPIPPQPPSFTPTSYAIP